MGLCHKSLTIMPVLRDLYSVSKKNTSAYPSCLFFVYCGSTFELLSTQKPLA